MDKSTKQGEKEAKGALEIWNKIWDERERESICEKIRDRLDSIDNVVLSGLRRRIHLKQGPIASATTKRVSWKTKIYDKEMLLLALEEMQLSGTANSKAK
ncbi:hypothetical protein TSAR_016333 [Trichomalopsis sarcophagae]|uniref:Uncharacterized protein n=1 Tax=Trichomalopsis sarcophagae TaxID=543379 RepID=A0A232EWJ4_9HYME|nr:hypothetical protein TSAR_016333 [Trichomalopsis sarcophagae]